METKAKLKNWRKKTISIEELAELLRTQSDSELWRLVVDMESEGLLTPVKASGKNGNRKYPLYMKYHINIQEDYSGILDEIALLHPAILKSEYLQSRQKVYLENRDALRKLNTYLFQAHSNVSVSRKERSFAIFGEEKQLEDSAFINLLKRLDLTPAVLRYYDTPEYCFNDFIPMRKSQMVLLICENKDIWFNIRRRMYEDGCRKIFNMPIDGVVYGCGNRISEAGALDAYTEFLESEAVHYLYWGDIDRAGFDIYLSVLKNNRNISVELFAEAYCEMLRLAEGLCLPDSSDGRSHTVDYGEILRVFSEEAQEKIGTLLENNKRLPQEIISYEVLLTCMR